MAFKSFRRLGLPGKCESMKKTYEYKIERFNQDSWQLLELEGEKYILIFTATLVDIEAYLRLKSQGYKILF